MALINPDLTIAWINKVILGILPWNALIGKICNESELFGHERDAAFKDAQQQRKGLIKLADTGTLSLGEVRELLQDKQVKLLRVLQDCEIKLV